LMYSDTTDDATRHHTIHDSVTSGNCEADDSDRRYPYIHGSPVYRENVFIQSFCLFYIQ